MTIIRRLLGARGFSPSEQFQRGFSRGIASGSPDPTWTPRSKQPIPFEGAHVALDPRELQSCYPLMISAFVPRPIALVSSRSAAGVGNVAPFSYSGVVNHDPPAIAVSVCRVGAGGRVKDTAANILETGEFVVNVMSEWFVEAANHTCGQFASDADEMAEANLSPAASLRVAPPRVGESAVQFECKTMHTHEMRNRHGLVTATLFVGEVVMCHVHDSLLDLGYGPGKPRVKFDGFAPVSRLGGNTYGSTTRTYDLDRPDRSDRNV